MWNVYEDILFSMAVIHFLKVHRTVKRAVFTTGVDKHANSEMLLRSPQFQRVVI